jgi:hypothetical protein
MEEIDQPAADPISSHVDGCKCPRCEDLTECPVCERQKLDSDWCWHCRRLIFLGPAI